MTTLYSISGSSRQALHQFLQRQHVRADLEEEVKVMAKTIREKHPRMGCRTMYDLMTGVNIGRDRCEQILLANGFRVKRRINYIRTTFSQAIRKFPDLIKGLVVTRINQVWQTDITYYLTDNGKVYYLVFIEDIYSRRILSWQASENLKAAANVACLLQAIRMRGQRYLRGLIHHSDRGSQFVAKEYLDILKKHSIRISMCKQAWQNAYTERLNGTIKDNYIHERSINTLAELRIAVKRAVHAYNAEKPHKNLPKRMSPVAFERYLSVTERSQHPKVKIFDYEE